jgi:hypothetical protein
MQSVDTAKYGMRIYSHHSTLCIPYFAVSTHTPPCRIRYIYIAIYGMHIPIRYALYMHTVFYRHADAICAHLVDTVYLTGSGGCAHDPPCEIHSVCSYTPAIREGCTRSLKISHSMYCIVPTTCV